jgi:uncharacterized membrane protein
MGTCSKCGKELSNNARYCKACGSGQAVPDASLDKKKARVTGQERSWAKPAVIAGAALMIAAVAWVFISNGRSGSSAVKQAPITAQSAPVAMQTNNTVVAGEGGSVRVPLPALDDRKAHFYLYESGGKAIKFFVLRASDGSVRAALDACTVCYHAKRGYRQDGDAMICNNCGMRFSSKDIGIITGGCNPIPVKNVIEKQAMVLKVKDLEAGAKYF